MSGGMNAVPGESGHLQASDVDKIVFCNCLETPPDSGGRQYNSGT